LFESPSAIRRITFVFRVDPRDADGRAVIRIDGKRYERQLVRILDDRDG